LEISAPKKQRSNSKKPKANLKVPSENTRSADQIAISNFIEQNVQKSVQSVQITLAVEKSEKRKLSDQQFQSIETREVVGKKA
jgi:hypothetical protein